MKFVRGNLATHTEVATAEDVRVEVVPEVRARAATVEVENTQTVETAEAVVAEVPAPATDVVEAVANEVAPEPTSKLEDKYQIPEFEPTVKRAGVAYFERASRPEAPIEVIVEAPEVSHIEGVEEVPEDATVVDGVTLVGDLAPEVEEELNELTSVDTDETPTPPAETPETVEEAVAKDDTPLVEEDELDGSSEVPANAPKALFSETWDAFVDNVIVPTFCTLLDLCKEHIKTVVKEDLKKADPEVK